MTDIIISAVNRLALQQHWWPEIAGTIVLLEVARRLRTTSSNDSNDRF